jgi:predicted CXXCH cytochrome family protein
MTTRAVSGRVVSMYVDSRVLRDSAHSRLDCVTCHTGLDKHPDEPASTGAVDRAAAAVVMCESCHEAASSGYGESVHGAPVLTGTGAGATCIDCHATDAAGHATARLAGVPSGTLAESVAENCGGCHESALDTYRMTAHSQLVRFGDGARAATCSSCHGAHAIVAAGSGALTPARLAPVCQQCHDGADAKFAEAWRGHEASASPAGLADGLHKGVIALMALCLAFGLAHTTIDFVRRPRRPWGGS